MQPVASDGRSEEKARGEVVSEEELTLLADLEGARHRPEDSGGCEQAELRDPTFANDIGGAKVKAQDTDHADLQ